MWDGASCMLPTLLFDEYFKYWSKLSNKYLFAVPTLEAADCPAQFSTGTMANQLGTKTMSMRRGARMRKSPRDQAFHLKLLLVRDHPWLCCLDFFLSFYQIYRCETTPDCAASILFFKHISYIISRCETTPDCAAWTLNTKNGWCGLKAKNQVDLASFKLQSLILHS